jgi:hypothetical protein
MIKQLPGWANYLALWAFYMLISWLMCLVTGWKADWRLLAFITAVYAGGYLAKWRFHDGGWHFN